MKTTTIGFGALVASLAVSAAFAQQVGDGPRGYDHMWGGGYGMFGGLMMLVFWGVIIALIVFAVKWFTDGKTGNKQPDAVDTLRDRFAKGEIDEEEFQKRKKALED